MRLGKFAVSQAVWFFTGSKLPAIKQQDKQGGSWEEKEKEGQEQEEMEEEGEGGAVLPKKSNASQVDISGPPTGLFWIFSSLQIDLANIFVLAHKKRGNGRSTKTKQIILTENN